jgi:hypothetical protein
MRRLREDIVENFKKFDLQQYDSIEDYAGALFYANSVSLVSTYSPEDVKKLNDEVVALRGVFLEDARSLASHNMLDGERLKVFKKGTQSYEQNATELLSLATMLRIAWPKIAGNTPVKLADISRAEGRSNQLAMAQKQQDQSNQATDEATLRRQQAYTLFINAYDRARQAAVFLRWDQEDDQLFVPSLYSGRKGKSRRKSDPTNPPDAPAPEEPTAPVPAAPAHADAAPAGEAPAAHGAAPGQPGSKPFIHK